MKHLKKIVILYLLSMSQLVHADLLMIANKSLEVDSLSKKEIVDLYMGRSKFVATDIKVTPFDIDDRQIKEIFYKNLLNKTLSEVSSYWARLLFSGRATPPLSLNNSQEVIELIKRNPSAIGYIRDAELTDDVKVIGYVD